MKKGTADANVWVRWCMYGGIAILLTMFALTFLTRFFEPDRAHGKEHIVTLTADGFTPSELTIGKDDVVVFRSELSKPFWPASNLHPSHSIYPAFDPQQPIASDDSWQFQFTQAGTWKYHDHLNPEQTGVISVEDGAEQARNAAVSDDCGARSGPEKIQCFDTMLEYLLKEEGIEAAFDYFISIYNADPEVPAVCHGWAHRLGEVEYGLYKEGKEVSLRPEATFCSYGYFHGFINTMVKDTQDVETVVQFCEDAVRRSKGELRGMLNNCIHGIGHSISTLMLENPSYWGDFTKITHAGSAICEELYAEIAYRNICFDGLFHELHISVMHDDYGMSFDAYKQTGDMFHYCVDLEEKYKESCYYDFITLWPYFFGQDKKASMTYVLENMVAPEQNGLRAFKTFGRSFIEADIANKDYEQSVAACELASGALRESCIDGLATGFVEHGEPNRMHEQGFAFCRDYYDGDTERLCLNKMLNALSWNYSASQFKQACDELSDEEASLCALYKNTPGS